MFITKAMLLCEISGFRTRSRFRASEQALCRTTAESTAKLTIPGNAGWVSAAASLMHAGSHLFFDPRGHLIHLWNKIFLSACLLSLFALCSRSP